MKGRRSTSLLVLLVLIVLLSGALTHCHRGPGDNNTAHTAVTQPAPSARTMAIPPAPSSQPMLASSRAPKHRPWELHLDSPFTLVAEGLRRAGVAAIDDATLVYSAPCDWRPSDAPNDEPDSFSIYPVAEDRFQKALPSSPRVGRKFGGPELFGRWPDDVWMRVNFRRDTPGQGYQFFHWDQRRWNTLPVKSGVKGIEPYEVLDWFDGAKLVAQMRKWKPNVSYAVEPFLILGSSTHAPPDFSGLAFPLDARELQHTDISYAALPTHEVFVAHTLNAEVPRRGFVTIAYSTRAGQVVMERIIDVPGSAGARFATGKLGDRDVVVAWGDAGMTDRLRPFMQLYDGVSSQKVAVPPPPVDRYGLSDVWIAGGTLWARRWARLGDPSKIWRFDGTAWTKFAEVEPGAKLAAVPSDGSLWGVHGADVFRFDATGRRTDVPFIVDPTKDVRAYHLVVAGPDDVWLVASGLEDMLVFRTKKMTSLLSCD